jgi:tellurite resistance protein TerC
MLIEYFGIHIPISISLGVIVLCLGGSILYSMNHNRKASTKKVEPENSPEPFN